MKLLLDENLSARLVDSLAEEFPNAQHVNNVGLNGKSDDHVWSYAKAKNLIIVSKDSDFADRSVLEGPPPKVIWVRAGNCTTATIAAILVNNATTIRRFAESGNETLLLLQKQ